MPKKKKAKTSQQLKKECLTASQLHARLESADENGYVTCVSCGVTKHYKDGMHGGHFIDKGHSSYWALEPCNIWPQCASCNMFGMNHGTASYEYHDWMIDKFGKPFVDQMIEDKRKIRKFSTQDYRELLATLTESIKYHKRRVGEL